MMVLSTLLVWLEHFLATVALLSVARAFYKHGPKGALRSIIHGLRAGIPGLNALIEVALQREAGGALEKLVPTDEDDTRVGPDIAIPKEGVPAKALLEQMRELKGKDVSADDGKLFAFVYTTDKQEHIKMMREAMELFDNPSMNGDKALDAFLGEAYSIFAHENGLNPAAFPSLRKFETEAVHMVLNMLHGTPACVGNMTSGGTESIIMAMKTYRDMARAKRPNIRFPEVIAPITVHPAFEKAAAYFDIKMVHIPVDENSQGDMVALKKAITNSTILIVMSAPQYPHGAVDPIEAAGEIAIANSLPLHVDACFGGFMLPWVEKLGYPVPKWDFRVPGVTSISADVHKYGWGTKGCSFVLFRNKSMRKYMVYAYSQWPGGLFASPGMSGTRPGGIIAATWASLMALGEDGYLKFARVVMEATNKMVDGISEIAELELVCKPVMSCFAVKTKKDSGLSILDIADVMQREGWHLERQQHPACLHFSIMPHHLESADRLVQAFKDAIKEIQTSGPMKRGEGVAAMYGMVATMPDQSLVTDFLATLMNDIYV
eukprot:m.71156 g.71156  ORF g.71156 m.71156 type:complete len:547 (-) comp12283_c0_seq1:281-1921(-)